MDLIEALKIYVLAISLIVIGVGMIALYLQNNI